MLHKQFFLKIMVQNYKISFVNARIKHIKMKMKIKQVENPFDTLIRAKFLDFPPIRLETITVR